MTERTRLKRWRHLRHLARRWAGSLSRKPPKPAHEQWARLCLNPLEQTLWAMMPNADRRHSIRVARRFYELRPNASRAEIAGALLHDVGKTVSGFGTTGRVLATVVGPRTRRFRQYHEHEAIGARLAQNAGSHPITVGLIAGTPGTPGLDELRAADNE